MWLAIFLLFSEVRLFACWHLESDTLMLMYRTTGLHPRRKLSSHSPTSGTKLHISNPTGFTFRIIQ
jgi:hypothetical protein